MKFEMKMPDLATTGSEIRVVRWIVSAGDRVKRGQPLLEVETDKATMAVEYTVDGTLVATTARENQLIASGEIIATLETADALPHSGGPSAPKPGGMFARNRASDAAVSKSPSPPVGIPLSPAHLTAARRLQESKR